MEEIPEIVIIRRLIQVLSYIQIIQQPILYYINFIVVGKEI